MLAAKKRFEELTGQPYDPPKETTKKVKGPAKMPPPERAPGEKSKKVSKTGSVKYSASRCLYFELPQL